MAITSLTLNLILIRYSLIKYNTDFIGDLLFDTCEVRVVSLFPMKDYEDNLVELDNAKIKTDLKFVLP